MKVSLKISNVSVLTAGVVQTNVTNYNKTHLFCPTSNNKSNLQNTFCYCALIVRRGVGVPKYVYGELSKYHFSTVFWKSWMWRAFQPDTRYLEII